MLRMGHRLGVAGDTVSDLELVTLVSLRSDGNAVITRAICGHARHDKDITLIRMGGFLTIVANESDSRVDGRDGP